MSILIKGMEMPRTCRDCPCFNEEYLYCRAKEGDDWSGENRPSDCPLVPVPPHGDLIDRDALLQEHERIVDSWGLAHIVSAQAIRNAPTIIPAEEGE